MTTDPAPEQPPIRSSAAAVLHVSVSLHVAG
jgi:hypothetical protein